MKESEVAAVARWQPPAGSRVDRWVTALVIALCELVMRRLNRFEIDGLERLEGLLAERGGRGLLTYSNHVSLLDDPLVLANFGMRRVPYDGIRWVAADALILFGSRGRAWLFGKGKVVPVVRGGGVGQPGLDFLVERLRAGDWVHIFPEGGANRDPEPRLRAPFKLGIGRLIAEAGPVVLPFYHRGMEQLSPPGRTPFGRGLRTGRRVRVLFGEPADCGPDFLARLAAGPAAGRPHWTAICDWAYGLLADLEDRIYSPPA